MVAKDEGPLLDARVTGARDSFGYEMMVRREVADRIGVRRVSGEEVRLTATAAEVLRLLGTAPARLLHPGVAAKAIEAGRIEPDPLDARVRDVGEFESRQHAGRVTRQGGS